MRELSNDLREFIHLLNAKKVRYLLVGAWAVAFHARPRYTADVDFFVEPGSENAVRLMEVIEEFGFGGIGIEAADFLQTDCVIQLGRAPNRVDLLTGISGVSFGEVQQTARKTERMSNGSSARAGSLSSGGEFRLSSMAATAMGRVVKGRCPES